MPYLTTPIKSHTTGKLYSDVNEEVTQIRVGIVERKRDGFRFPCLPQFLSDSMVVVELVEEKKEVKPQLSLF